MRDVENAVVKIYELRDPRDVFCEPRYIGITVQSLKRRLSMHVRKNYLIPKTYKNNWIKSLIKDGVLPTIHLIEEVIGWDNACNIEKYFIKEFKNQNYRLTNSTDGGEGLLGIKFSEEQLKNRSEKLLGHVLSEETKQKISKSHTGYKYNEAAKLNMSKSKMGLKHSEETKLKIKLSNIGKKRTTESVEKMAATKRKPVVLIYDNGEIFEFICIADCAKFLNIKLETAKSYINTSKNKKRNYKIYKKEFITLNELGYS